MHALLSSKKPAKRNTIYLYGFNFKWGHVVIIVRSCFCAVSLLIEEVVFGMTADASVGMFI